jgi:hypothetical protein
MQVVNLDKITTRKDKVIILGGVEHVMRTPTVKDYIEQMKKAEKIQALSETATIDSATKLLEITIETLMLSFPTITKDQFEKLDMDQLNALRALAEGELDADVNGGAEGEATGMTG